jgi:hypothetical protein
MNEQVRIINKNLNHILNIGYEINNNNIVDLAQHCIDELERLNTKKDNNYER